MNIFASDTFYQVCDTEICTYADDATLYIGDKTFKTILTKLEEDTLLFIKWFSNNVMKLNDGKCHLLVLEAEDQGVTITGGTTEELS